MAELPTGIHSALIHEINTLESDSRNQFQWKLTRNLENVSLFVKCVLLTQYKVVHGSFPLKPARQKTRKKMTPPALSRSANRLKHFQEKKTAEPAAEVISAV